MDTLSVAAEHRECFRIVYAAADKYVKKNDKIYRANFIKFKRAIEQELLQLSADKMTALFGDAYMNEILIDFEFFTYSINGNSGGTDFMFDDNPEIAFLINFNKNLRAIYKRDIREFCLTISDIFTHELIHGIQYIKQYKSVGVKEELLRESIFQNKEHLFKKDIRFRTSRQYREDLPYFSKHEELVCYAKDSARQLLTAYKTKENVFNKLSDARGLEELSKASDCFYYYYDCFYNKMPELQQYKFLWKKFIKYLYRNLHEDFEI